MCILVAILNFRSNIVIFFGYFPVNQMISVFVPKREQTDRVNCLLCWKHEFSEVLDTLAAILYFLVKNQGGPRAYFKGVLPNIKIIVNNW